MRTLVIVPCGAQKVWTKQPDLGPVAARDAYTGTPFRVNRAYAETLGDAWVILSAKYGYLWPTDLIPGPYEVTFKRAATQPVQMETLRAQVEQLELSTYEQVIGLGGKEYQQAIEQSFGPQTHLSFPFAGLPLGYALQATNAARQAKTR